MSAKGSILIVDDEKYVRESMAAILEADGHSVQAVDGAKAALARLEVDDVDVLVSDLKMPKVTGQALLESVRADHPEIAVILLTGAGSVTDAVKAMKAGAFDFILKPIDPSQLEALVDKAVAHTRMQRELGVLRANVKKQIDAARLIGESNAMRQVLRAIEQVAPGDTVVLLRGESGVGKHVAAREVHRRSPRSQKPIVTVDCSMLTDENFEWRLFGKSGKQRAEDGLGYVREAEGGTLILDEIGVLSTELQSRLSRFIESREFTPAGSTRSQNANVRIVALTNQDVEAAMRDGHIRQDFYFRVGRFPIDLPPLRSREGDLRLLAKHFLAVARNAADRAPIELSEDAWNILESHDWPGNVRELENCIQRACILSQEKIPDAMLLRAIVESSTAPMAPAAEGFNLRDNVDAVEKQVILKALAHTGGRKAEAAALLGIDPKNFGYYIRKHRLAEVSRGHRS